MYLRICASNDDLEHTSRIRSLTLRFFDSQGCKVSSCGKRRLCLIRLGGCAGRFEYSMGAHVRSHFFLHCGSFHFLYTQRQVKGEQNEPAHDKTNKGAPSEGSNQPAHPRSLIRVIADRMRLLQPSGYPKRMEETFAILGGCTGWS